MSDPVSWIVGLGLLAVVGVAFVYFLVALLVIIPTWRIFRRAGLSGALSLFLLLPGIGALIVMAILAFATWPAGEARRR